jgi:hypothetical protein
MHLPAGEDLVVYGAHCPVQFTAVSEYWGRIVCLLTCVYVDCEANYIRALSIGNHSVMLDFFLGLTWDSVVRRV